jgi:hypothetical protein
VCYGEQNDQEERRDVELRTPFLSTTYLCCSKATCHKNRSKSSGCCWTSVDNPTHACSLLCSINSVSSTLAPNDLAPNDCSLTSASRARQVHELQPLDLGCCICCYRRLRATRPNGNRSREYNVYARHRLSCSCGLHRALRNHNGDWIGDLRCFQRRASPAATERAVK